MTEEEEEEAAAQQLRLHDPESCTKPKQSLIYKSVNVTCGHVTCENGAF